MLIAQLEGATCSVPSLGVSVTRNTGCPILSLCRALVKADHGDEALSVWRGDKPVMEITSIARAATLAVREGNDGRPRFVKYQAPTFADAVGGIVEPVAA